MVRDAGSTRGGGKERDGIPRRDVYTSLGEAGLVDADAEAVAII